MFQGLYMLNEICEWPQTVYDLPQNSISVLLLAENID